MPTAARDVGPLRLLVAVAAELLGGDLEDLRPLHPGLEPRRPRVSPSLHRRAPFSGSVSSAARASPARRATAGWSSPAPEPFAGVVEPAAVDALDDDRDLPVRERDPVAEVRRDRVPTRRAYSAASSAPVGKPATAVTGSRNSAPACPAAAPSSFQYATIRPTSASGSPTVQSSQSSTARTSPSVRDDGVVEPVVAVDEHRLALLRHARPRAARRPPRSPAAPRSSTRATGGSSAGAGGSPGSRAA